MSMIEANRIGRRRMLKIGLGAAVATTLAGPAHALARVPRRVLSVHNAHTNESLTAEYFADGWYNPDVLDQFDRFWRDWRTGDIITVDSGLLDLLYLIQEKLGGTKPLTLLSGYRSPKTNAMLASMQEGVARNSFHMYGRAADITVTGSSIRRIRDTALDLGLGGVGYYPRSNFVHVDTGPLRRW